MKTHKVYDDSCEVTGFITQDMIDNLLATKAENNLLKQEIYRLREIVTGYQQERSAWNQNVNEFQFWKNFYEQYGYGRECKPNPMGYKPFAGTQYEKK